MAENRTSLGAVGRGLFGAVVICAVLGACSQKQLVNVPLEPNVAGIGVAPHTQKQDLEDSPSLPQAVENHTEEGVSSRVAAGALFGALAAIATGVVVSAPLAVLALPVLGTAVGGIGGLAKSSGGAAVRLDGSCAYLKRIGIVEPYDEQDVKELEILDDPQCAEWVRSRIIASASN
ncbi:hypothetical protein HJ526_14790 [Donghicola sp. C2-DW-16]|uniref:Lipoprotein n=1 Tax=Donghicola mangrovi TaxID=2729614 RepID=A0ABX2PGS3_9RHOB|nr:hypothetical protein [Donghicola mangrovi]NVO28695.1 hypothetical protein [Donghicola mangrovi]